MDSFFGIGPFELIFILIFALIFLGPERLPAVVRDVAGFLRKIQLMYSEITQQLNDEFSDLRELDPRYQLDQMLKEDEKEEQKTEKQKTDAKAEKPKAAQSAEEKAAPSAAQSEAEVESASPAKTSTGEPKSSKPQGTVAREYPPEATPGTGPSTPDEKSAVVDGSNGAVKDPTVVETTQTVPVAKMGPPKSEPSKKRHDESVATGPNADAESDGEEDGSTPRAPLDPAALGPVRKFGPDKEQKSWVMPGTEKQQSPGEGVGEGAIAESGNGKAEGAPSEPPRRLPKQRSESDQVSPASAHLVESQPVQKSENELAADQTENGLSSSDDLHGEEKRGEEENAQEDLREENRIAPPHLDSAASKAERGEAREEHRDEDVPSVDEEQGR